MSGKDERPDDFDYYQFYLDRLKMVQNGELLVEEERWYHHACFYCGSPDELICPYRNDGYNQEDSLCDAVNGSCLGAK